MKFDGSVLAWCKLLIYIHGVFPSLGSVIDTVWLVELEAF